MKTKSVLLSLGVLLVTVANWQLPFLRFTNYLANEVVALFVSLIPLLLVGAGIMHVNKRLTRWISVPLTLGLLLISLPLLAFVGIKLFALPPLNNEEDASFAKIEQIEQTDGYVVIYRTNGGATTAYGIVVRQELKILPGVLLVKEVFSQYGWDRIEYTKTESSLTVIDPYFRHVLQVVPLKRFLYL